MLGCWILWATMLGCWISSKICSMMCTLGALMLWGRVINTSTISTMLSLLAMIISLKNMTAGLVPAILTVSSKSLLSMGLFSTSTKMALISSTVHGDHICKGLQNGGGLLGSKVLDVI